MPSKKTTSTKPATKPAAAAVTKVFKPTKSGPVAVNPEEAKLRDLTIAFVKGDQSNQATAAEVAGAVAAHFKTRETFEDGKTAFQVGFILPGLDKKHRDAFEVSIPDGRTEEGKKPKWAAARKARAAVQKTLSTYFTRIRDRAFPVETETKPTSLKTWTDEILARIIKRHEKADNGNPDVIKMVRKAQEANARTSDADSEEDE